MGGTARHAQNPAAQGNRPLRSRKSFHSSGAATSLAFLASGFGFFAGGSSSSIELMHVVRWIEIQSGFYTRIYLVSINKHEESDRGKAVLLVVSSVTRLAYA